MDGLYPGGGFHPMLKVDSPMAKSPLTERKMFIY